LYKHCTIPL